jgi:hypothetical protein
MNIKTAEFIARHVGGYLTAQENLAEIIALDPEVQVVIKTGCSPRPIVAIKDLAATLASIKRPDYVREVFFTCDVIDQAHATIEANRAGPPPGILPHLSAVPDDVMQAILIAAKDKHPTDVNARRDHVRARVAAWTAQIARADHAQHTIPAGIVDAGQAALLALIAGTHAIDTAIPLLDRAAALCTECQRHAAAGVTTEARGLAGAVGLIRELIRDAAGTLRGHASSDQPIPEEAAARLRAHVRRVMDPAGSAMDLIVKGRPAGRNGGAK